MKPSTEEQVLDVVNSVPKYRVFLFLRDNGDPCTRSEIADAVDLHPNNLSGYLREMETDDVVTHEREGNTKLWQLTEEVRADLETPEREYVPTIDLADVEADYEYDTTNDLSVKLSKRNPESVREALSADRGIPGGSVGVLLIGVLLVVLGISGYTSIVWVSVGRLLFVAGLAASLTVVAIATKEVYS